MSLDYYSNLTLNNRYDLCKILDSMIQADIPDSHCLSMLLELTFCDIIGDRNNFRLLLKGMKVCLTNITGDSIFQQEELQKRLAKIDRLLLLYERNWHV